MTELKQVFMIDDKTFETKAEAMDYVRRPKIKEALLKFTKQEDVATWLIDSQDSIENAFETGTIKRITKSDAKKLEKAIEVLREAGLKGTEFLVDNWEELEIKYRPVKRMTDEEKAVAAKNSLLALTDGDDDLASWIVDHKNAILEAYEAGKEKRQVNPNAANALAEYRAKKAAEKAAAESAEDDLDD